VLKENAALTEMKAKEYLADKLADYKIPRIVVFVEEIPKGSTGKIQRIGLAEKLGIDMSDQSELQLKKGAAIPPRTCVESAVHKIWEQILKTDVGVTDNFFSVGGDSITATRILSRYQDQFNYEMSFLSFFDGPTIRLQGRSLMVHQMVHADPEEYQNLVQEIEGLPEDEIEIMLHLISDQKAE
jgi:hypothetical protein